MIGFLNGFDELDGEDLLVAVTRHRPIADMFAHKPRDRVRSGQRDGELGQLALDHIVTELRGELDDRRRDLRADGGFGGDHGFARHFRRATLPAQGELRFRAKKAAHAGEVVGLDGFDDRASEQLQINIRAAGLRVHAGDGGKRAFERDVIPRLGARDLGDDVELELIFSSARNEETIDISLALDAQAIGEFWRQ